MTADTDQLHHPPITGNIVLTGFMGTGKSTVGRILADRLGWRFIDTDAVIEKWKGPIPQIFAEQGEATFRMCEQVVAGSLALRSELVVSTGGRLMLDETNQGTLGATGRVFCLIASAGTIAERLAVADERHVRPLLDVDDPEVRIAALLAERAEGYAQFEQVATDGSTPAEVADQILVMLSR